MLEEKGLDDSQKYQILVEALFHDLHEGQMGDIPYDVKGSSQELHNLIHESEVSIEKNIGFNFKNSDIIKLCDMVELVQTLFEETILGNKTKSVHDMIIYGMIYSYFLNKKVKSSFINYVLEKNSERYFKRPCLQIDRFGAQSIQDAAMHMLIVNCKLFSINHTCFLGKNEERIPYEGSKAFINAYSKKYYDALKTIEKDNKLFFGFITKKDNLVFEDEIGVAIDSERHQKMFNNLNVVNSDNIVGNPFMLIGLDYNLNPRSHVIYPVSKLDVDNVLIDGSNKEV